MEQVMTNANALVAAATATAVATKGADYLMRTAGSRVPSLTTGEESVAFLDALVVADVTEEAVALGASFGACRYFRGSVPLRLGAVEAIALVDDLDDNGLAAVRLRRGRHGIEMVSAMPMRPTTEVHIIVGHNEDPAVEPTVETAMCYTWYPGRLTASVRLDTVAALAAMSDEQLAMVRIVRMQFGFAQLFAPAGADEVGGVLIDGRRHTQLEVDVDLDSATVKLG